MLGYTTDNERKDLSLPDNLHQHINSYLILHLQRYVTGETMNCYMGHEGYAEEVCIKHVYLTQGMNY